VFKDLHHTAPYLPRVAVATLKREVRYQVIGSDPVDRKRGATSDQTVQLLGTGWSHFPEVLRRVGYRDPDTGMHFVFPTHNFHLSARTIAGIYKARWEVELYFKRIEQHLKIRTFLGTSRNAVLAQIWAVACAYLLLAYLRLISRSSFSLLVILWRVAANLFDRRGLFALFDPDAAKRRSTAPSTQLALLPC
jgi:putative transposase